MGLMGLMGVMREAQKSDSNMTRSLSQPRDRS